MGRGSRGRRIDVCSGSMPRGSPSIASLSPSSSSPGGAAFSRRTLGCLTRTSTLTISASCKRGSRATTRRPIILRQRSKRCCKPSRRLTPPKPSGAPPASSPSEALAVPGDVPSASTPRPTLSRPPTDTLAPSVCPAPSPCPAVRPVPQASPLRQERSPSATTYDPRLTYTANQTIFHRDFGDGVVSQVEGSRIVAIFATGARMLQHAPARPSAPLPRAPALSRSR